MVALLRRGLDFDIVLKDADVKNTNPVFQLLTCTSTRTVLQSLSVFAFSAPEVHSARRHQTQQQLSSVRGVVTPRRRDFPITTKPNHILREINLRRPSCP